MSRLRELEANLRLLRGDNNPAAQRIARSPGFSGDEFAARAVENRKCGFSPMDSISEAAEACGLDLSDDERAALTAVLIG